MTPLFRAVSAALEMTLSGKRFRHSLAVSRLAADLARRHGWDVEKARMAGLTHDCAKEWSPKKLLGYVRRRKLKVPELDFILKVSPNLMHAYVSADVARANRWITDPAQVRAVAAHTLGSEKMGVPEMIVFLADFASTDRTFGAAKDVRRLARKNLRAAFRAALGYKIFHQTRKSKMIHAQTIRTWNALVGGK